MGSRITLAQIMWVVAIVAQAFAAAPASLAMAFSSVLLVSVGIGVFFRASWTRIAGWIFACYPLLPIIALYTTWAAAWYSLGHLPRPSLDDPKYIGPLVNAPYMATGFLLFGFLPALAVSASLVAVEFFRVLHDDRDDLKRFTARVLLPMLSWPFAYAWLMADPGGVVNWFMD
ncbi:hypothetical protein P12x_005849 [Tundrisphaera lichenicola]|uniref:hypothetical protein n=1 Tax=Tundrisphaera lichenicola TaxID=2029860 RepID=UPI003EBD09B4